MRTVSISEMKNSLSYYIDRVRAGESVLVTDRGVVVARLEPVARGAEVVGRLERLERAGLIERARIAPPTDLLGRPGPRLEGGGSAVGALLAERSESR